MARNRNVNGNAICTDSGKGPNQKRQEATSSSSVIRSPKQGEKLKTKPKAQAEENKEREESNTVYRDQLLGMCTIISLKA